MAIKFAFKLQSKAIYVERFYLLTGKYNKSTGSDDGGIEQYTNEFEVIYRELACELYLFCSKVYFKITLAASYRERNGPRLFLQSCTRFSTTFNSLDNDLKHKPHRAERNESGIRRMLRVNQTSLRHIVRLEPKLKA